MVNDHLVFCFLYNEIRKYIHLTAWLAEKNPPSYICTVIFVYNYRGLNSHIFT